MFDETDSFFPFEIVLLFADLNAPVFKIANFTFGLHSEYFVSILNYRLISAVGPPPPPNNYGEMERKSSNR